MTVVDRVARGLSDSFIAEILAPYRVSCSHFLAEQIRLYVSLLLPWNRKVALTTITDPVEILKLHFGESLFAVSALPIREGRLADVGSGAGFPGLPIRLGAPQIDATLVEPNVKKATFLSEVARLLKLDRVTVFRGRMQDLPRTAPLFDFITARALGKHEELVEWSKPHLAKNGKLILWLGEEDARAISEIPSLTWQDPIHIPGSRKRVLLAGSAP